MTKNKLRLIQSISDFYGPLEFGGDAEREGSRRFILADIPHKMRRFVVRIEKRAGFDLSEHFLRCFDVGFRKKALPAHRTEENVHRAELIRAARTSRADRLNRRRPRPFGITGF